MKNAMQLKAKIKNIAKEKKVSAQFVLQNYMLERFLERVSLSDYQSNIVIKGGFLIASMIGIDSRATMDMDVTVKRMNVDKSSIQKMISDIIAIDLADDLEFRLEGIGDIRENDEYSGFRASLTALYPPLAVPIKIDITTGDRITPREIEYGYKLMFENRSINVLAYNIATLLAEKLEAIISRADQNTRMRDYYDVCILSKLRSEDIDTDTLSLALESTAKRRGSFSVIVRYREIMDIVQSSTIMKRQWDNYRRSTSYAKHMEFQEVCAAVITLLNKLEIRTND